MNQQLGSVTVACILGLTLGTQALADTASADLRNQNDEAVGEVALTDRNEQVEVVIEAESLPPGFHGFHIHAVGDCSASDFTSAGGHFNPGNDNHASHAGDLPTLLVMADGSGTMTVETDRFEVADLLEEDGSAIIIHARPDNYANIPERYQPPEVDQQTLDTGDAGDRLACGEIQQQ